MIDTNDVITIPPGAADAVAAEPGVDAVAVVAYAPVELGEVSVSAMASNRHGVTWP